MNAIDEVQIVSICQEATSVHARPVSMHSLTINAKVSVVWQYWMKVI